MQDSYACVFIIAYGFVFILVNANETEQTFTKGELLNDRVCTAEDRVVEQELTCKSNLQCAAVCSELTECSSYFYSKGPGDCVTCKGYQTMSNTLAAPGMTYYDGRKTGSSCLDVLGKGATESGVYTLYTPVTNTPVHVYCDMTTEGGGWIVWQRRFNGMLSFQKTFAEYEEGFGEPAGEYWLGLRHLQEFLQAKPSGVYLQFGDWGGIFGYEWFGEFGLTSGPAYTVTVTSFLNASYALAHGGFEEVTGMAFSTSDHNYVSCVDSRGGGGFWYMNCGPANANGLYGSEGEEGLTYIYNKSWKLFLALKETKLMIRETVFRP